MLGNIISINGEQVSSPFEIKAIGNQETMYGAITRPGGYISYMKEANVKVTVKKNSNIEISKYGGNISAKYMKNK